MQLDPKESQLLADPESTLSVNYARKGNLLTTSYLFAKKKKKLMVSARSTSQDLDRITVLRQLSLQSQMIFSYHPIVAVSLYQCYSILVLHLRISTIFI